MYIGIEVTSPRLGGLSEVVLNGERRFSAQEIVPGLYKVFNKGVSFAFTKKELNEEVWIKEIPSDE